MWSLCALCVLLSLVPGLNTGGGDHTEMYVRPGSDVLLPLSYKLAIDKTNKRCDTFDWKFERSKVLYRISKSRYCDIQEYKNMTDFFNYYTSADGTLSLINITWKDSGKYNVTVNNLTTGSPIFTHTYTLHVQAPVSEPFLNVSCRRDGGANIICGTDTREDLSFSIMVNKGLLPENATSSKMVGNVSEVHTTAASPGPWDITCSVRNRVSDSETRRANVICPVPLSDPVLEASCLQNGSLTISCSVENGTDPIFFLNVNETLFSANVKKGVKRVNHVTVPSPDHWDVHCYVSNSLGEKNATTNITCPVPLSDPVLNVSCHNDSSLEITCSVENGTDPIFSLSVNGELILKNGSTESKRVNATESISAPWDVHCSVRNNLGVKNTSKSYKTCLAPVSQPLLNITCLSNGSAVITCSVLSGTNPKFQLTVNGSILMPYNTKSSCCGYNYITSPGEIWNISCTVGNELGESTTSNSSHSWCGYNNCSICLQNSIIGGVVSLILTTSPLLIATFFVERNTRQKKP